MKQISGCYLKAELREKFYRAHQYQLIHSKEVPFSDGLKGDTFHFRTLNFPW